jgi:hypothetical protein
MSETVSRPTHPLHGLWLVRKTHHAANFHPFRSVMDIEDANIGERLALQSGKFFGGEDYIGERTLIETWMRNEAYTKGIKAKSRSPLYFSLRPQPVSTNQAGKLIFNFPAQALPPEATTFTFEDSFFNYACLRDRPYGHFDVLPQVLTADELSQTFQEHGFPDELDGRDNQRYIEAQVWDRSLAILQTAQRLSQIPLAQTAGIITLGKRPLSAI